MRRSAGPRAIVEALAAAVLLAGCARHAGPRGTVLHWLAGSTAPAFDPGGPPSALRGALERMLSYGLFERDSTGAVRPLAAESAASSEGGRAFTVRLRAGLAFTDGTPATSEDFRAALLAALGRADVGTAAWRLAPVAGVERIRPGRPLPAIGIDCPDARTLRFRLARPDSGMPSRLAADGFGAPWHARGGGAWAGAVGLGPYAVATEDPGRRIVFVRAGGDGPRRALADTVEARFVVGAPRVRFMLRHRVGDLVWPLPPALLGQALPADYSLHTREASPPRRLLLVFRADVPPTTSLAARQVLAHALNRSDLLEALDAPATPPGAWLEGAGPFDFPSFDAAEARQWLARGALGASFHVALAYDADGEGAGIARTLQSQWAAIGMDAELRPLRGAEALAEPMRSPAAQVQLVAAQAPADGAAGELAALVMPLRGPAVGAFRSGWRTREFDRWIAGGPGAELPDPASAQARLAEDRIALPIADLPWRWAQLAGGPEVAFRKGFGPDLAPATEPPVPGTGAPAGSH